MYQTCSDCAVMTETAAININFFLPGCRSSVRQNFLSYRAVHTWNHLPVNSTDFSNLRSFKGGLNSSFLARHCCLLLLDCFTLRRTIVFILVWWHVSGFGPLSFDNNNNRVCKTVRCMNYFWSLKHYLNRTQSHPHRQSMNKEQELKITCFSSHSGTSGQTSWLGEPNSSRGGRMNSLAPLGPGHPGGLGASPTGRHKSRRCRAASSHWALDTDVPSAFCQSHRQTHELHTLQSTLPHRTRQSLISYPH